MSGEEGESPRGVNSPFADWFTFHTYTPGQSWATLGMLAFHANPHGPRTVEPCGVALGFPSIQVDLALRQSRADFLCVRAIILYRRALHTFTGGLGIVW